MEQREENADVNDDLKEIDADANDSNGEIDERDETADVDNTEDAENTQNQGDSHEAESPVAVENAADECPIPGVNNDGD